jgi:hypothetical protein
MSSLFEHKTDFSSLQEDFDRKFTRSETDITFRARAKYYPAVGGGLRLASVCEFSHPVFRLPGFEAREPAGIPEDPLDYGLELEPEQVSESEREKYRERAQRRARTAAFDYVACNPDLDAFVTLTFDRSYTDRTSYDETYGRLKIWLANRVARRGLKYVCCPEYHHDGQAIHFHLLCNQKALKFSPSGHVNREGQPIYNLDGWKWGWSTLILIGETETDRDRVSKYIYKYMTKQEGQKIGGRYYLHGGRLNVPTYAFSDDPTEFFAGNNPLYSRNVKVNETVDYREWNFI